MVICVLGVSGYWEQEERGVCDPKFIATPYHPEIPEHEKDSKEYEIITELIKIPAEKWAEGIQSFNGIEVSLILRYYPIKAHFLVNGIKLNDDRVDDLASKVYEIQNHKRKNKEEKMRSDKLEAVLLELKNRIND